MNKNEGMVGKTKAEPLPRTGDNSFWEGRNIHGKKGSCLELDKIQRSHMM